jgi:cytochrome c-type biogenesis protein CcmH/NrfG
MDLRTSHPAARTSLPVIMGVMVVAIYFNSIGGFDKDTWRPYSRGQFMIDDHDAIENHPLVFHPSGLTRAWTTEYRMGRTEDQSLYRPVTILSYHLNARLIGWYPVAMGFRIFNIVMLWMLGVMVAWWLGNYVPHPIGPWIAAFLLVAHPANTELIDHIVGRADILAMMGVVGFALTQRHAIQRKGWTPWHAAAALVFAVVALGAKESGMLVVPVALMQAWLVRDRGKPIDFAARRRPRLWTVVLVGLPFVAYLAARTAVVGFMPHYPPSPNDDLTGNPLRAVDMPQRVAGALSIAWFYFKQVFWPTTNWVQTPTELPTWSSASVWLGLAVLLAWVSGIAWAVRRRHWLSVPLVLGLGQYLAIGNLFWPSGVYTANRMMLPMLLSASAVLAVWVHRAAHASPRAQALAVIPAAVVFVVMAAIDVSTNDHWLSTRRLANAESVAQPDHPITWYLQGTARAEDGELEDAAYWLERAVNARPDSIEARRNLAEVRLQQFIKKKNPYAGDVAEREWEYILKYYPNNMTAHLQLAKLAFAKATFDAADDQRRNADLDAVAYHLNLAEKLDPTHPEVMYNLAELAVARHDYVQARRRYQALLDRYPNHLEGKRQFERYQKALLRETKDEPSPDSGTKPPVTTENGKASG